MKDITIEVDITHRCNMACRHCNRLCNADANYGIKRSIVDMDMRHINFLISEIKRLPKESVRLIRILGGEPLLSNILVDAVQAFISLIEEGIIKELNIVTNGTIPVPEVCKPFVVYAPQIVKEMVKERGFASPRDIYTIKNNKHRNITISPIDYNLDYEVCKRVQECGIHYSVFGFSYTAPCFPSIIVNPNNHQYFLHRLPSSFEDFIPDQFRKDVCSICCFAILNYNRLAEENPNINELNFQGQEWHKQVLNNKGSYNEADTSWINYI